MCEIYKNSSPRIVPMTIFSRKISQSSCSWHFIFSSTHFSLVFQPILYKFIVLDFLGLSLFFLGQIPNLVLTIFIYYSLIVVFFREKKSFHFLKNNKIVLLNYDVMYYNIIIILIRKKRLKRTWRSHTCGCGHLGILPRL